MAQAPCIVFIHGALNDQSVWNPVASRLGERRFELLDLPGHTPGSGLPQGSIETLADWVWTELDRRGVREACLVGHSMGSLIALEAAARQPARARGLVLVGTACPMRVSEAVLNAARDDVQGAMAMVDGYSRSQPDPDGMLLGLMRRVLAAQPALNLLEHDLRLCDRYAGGLDAAAQVTCPSLLILGEFDKMTPAKRAQGLLEALRAEVRMLPAGHALMAEAPEALALALVNFVERP
jgi:pimeloyl-ACP methyl ester carboxylesterase